MNEFQEFIADSITETGWTPDIPLLDTQDEWYVFVYGDRRGKKSGFFTHVDSDAQFMSIGWTKSTIYDILTVQDGNKTVHLANTSGLDRILGEVWRVPTDMLIDLDAEERHLLHTQRVTIPIVISGGVVVSAWIYLIDKSYLVSGGKSISKYTGVTYIGPQRFLEIH